MGEVVDVVTSYTLTEEDAVMINVIYADATEIAVLRLWVMDVADGAGWWLLAENGFF